MCMCVRACVCVCVCVIVCICVHTCVCVCESQFIACTSTKALPPHIVVVVSLLGHSLQVYVGSPTEALQVPEANSPISQQIQSNR